MRETNNSITALIMRSNGIDVSKFDASFLEKSIQKNMSETGCSSLVEYCAFLEQSDGARTALIDSLRISYSEFFRNPLTFAVLERIILPAIVLRNKNAGRREIRIWSAACAGGQEAYTLAILLEELGIGDTNKLTYRIFATDQSESEVNAAIKGDYAATALNSLSLKRAGEWFDRQGNIYTVKPELKKNMAFSTFDLCNEDSSAPPASIFGDFDLVFCANLLFYYKEEQRNKILRKICGTLADGGYLITGDTERDIVIRNGFRELFPQSAIFQEGKRHEP